jgi:hypothetical protein
MPDLWMPGAIRIESTRRNTLNGNGCRLVHAEGVQYLITCDGVTRLLDLGAVDTSGMIRCTPRVLRSNGRRCRPTS